jgi:hypothetical protein
VYFYSKKEREQKEDLETKINKQQGFVTCLLLEVEQLKQIQSKLICDAVKLYKRVRIFAVAVIVAFGFVCYGFYSLPLWASISGLLAFLAFVYYCYTLIKFNKFLDYNVALKKAENYFIIRKYRMNDFNPELINVYEQKLKTETEVLNQLIENHKNKTYL